MKKLMLIAGLPLAMMFQSCAKDEIEPTDALPKNSKQTEAVKELPQESPSDLGASIQASPIESTGAPSDGKTAFLQEYFIGRYIDRTVPPDVRKVCIKEAEIKTPAGTIHDCVEFALEKRYFYNTSRLMVTLRKPLDKAMVNELIAKCLSNQQGTAGVESVSATDKQGADVVAKNLESCMKGSLGEALAEVTLRITGEWGN